MKKKGKLIILISGAAIGLCVLIFAAKFIADGPYRKQIPGNPDSATISKPIQEQIADARQWAYYITTANHLGNLGMVYHSFADYETAAKCYTLASEKNSNEWIWNYYLGYLSLEQGQSNEAIKNFEQVLEKDPQNFFASYYAGEAYQKLGSNEEAERMFTKIIKADEQTIDEKKSGRQFYFPIKTYAMFQLARIYISANETDSAEILLKAIIQDQVSFGPAYRSLGNVYSTKGDTTLAKKYAVRANDLSDYAAPADKLLDKIALISRSDQYLLKQIEDATRSGNYRWALTLCNQALKYFPANKTLISNAVFENFRQGFDEKALSYLDKHFEYFNNDAKELMDVTDLLYNRQHLSEAKKYFDQVKKLMPNNSTLAIWLFERGKKDEAITMMNELIKQNPQDKKILADEVHLLLNLGEDELANDYFTTLKKYAPESPETLQVTGLMAEKKGDTATTLAAYEQANKTDPKDLIFTQTLIDLYIRQKKWQQAIGHFKASLDIYPNEPVLLEGIGRLLIACPDATLKNIPDGIEYSERAFINTRSSYQTKLSAGKTLVTVYLSLGDKKNATKYINQTIKVAEEGNQSQEYIAYFKALISK